jgi:hypothetical protein
MSGGGPKYDIWLGLVGLDMAGEVDDDVDDDVDGEVDIKSFIQDSRD